MTNVNYKNAIMLSALFCYRRMVYQAKNKMKVSGRVKVVLTKSSYVIFDNANKTVKSNGEIKFSYTGIGCRPKVKLKRKILMEFLYPGLVSIV